MRTVVLLLLLSACVPGPLQTVDKKVVDVAPPTTTDTAAQIEINPQGEDLFKRSCAGCHQPTGLGIPGNFPPLAQHVPLVLKTKGGREYLPMLVQNGLRGPIQILGQPYNGQMPSFSWLEDQQLSDILNYLSTAWGNAKLLPSGFKAYTPQEVNALRQKRLSSVEMLEVRKQLGLP